MVHFSSQAQKIKKNPPTKNSLHFRKWSFLALILKKFSQFLKRNLFLYFLKWNPELFSPNLKKKKKRKERKSRRENLYRLMLTDFLYFLKRKLFIYSGKRKPRKNSLYSKKRNFLIFQEIAFQAWKKKKNPLWRNFLYFGEGNFQPRGLKKLKKFNKAVACLEITKLSKTKVEKRRISKIS